MDLSKYFDLSLIKDNDNFYSSSEVEKGNHGGDKIGDELYFSLFHIKNYLAKNELKEFLDKFNTSEKLAFLGKEILENYDIEEIYVQYADHNFQIRKYPLSKVVEYYLKTQSLSGKAQGENIFAHNNNINVIGFANFRKFRKNTPLDIGAINLFVGQNNSGKSTYIKAILLIIRYLQTNDYRKFRLSDEIDQSTSVMTFERALNKDSFADKEDVISFNAMLDDNHFEIKITGSPEDSEAPVQELKLKTFHYECNIKLTGNFVVANTKFFRNQENTVGTKDVRDQYKENIDKLKRESDVLLTKIKKAEGSERTKLLTERISVMDQINSLQKNLGHLSKSKKAKKTGPIEVEIEFEDKYVSKKTFPGLIQYILDIIYVDPNIVPDEDQKDLTEILEKILGNQENGRSFVMGIQSLIDDLSIHHLGTNNAKMMPKITIRY